MIAADWRRDHLPPQPQRILIAAFLDQRLDHPRLPTTAFQRDASDELDKRLAPIHLIGRGEKYFPAFGVNQMTNQPGNAGDVAVNHLVPELRNKASVLARVSTAASSSFAPLHAAGLVICIAQAVHAENFPHQFVDVAVKVIDFALEMFGLDDGFGEQSGQRFGNGDIAACASGLDRRLQRPVQRVLATIF